MLGMPRRTWGWLGVVGLVVGALVGQGCGDVQSPDAAVGGVATATVVVAASATPMPTFTPMPAITPAPEAAVAAGDAVASSAMPMPTATAMSATATATPQVAADSQELLAETLVSDEENPSEADELSDEELFCLLSTSASYGPDPGFVSLDERILRSSVIARATMRSASAASLEYDTPTVYYPMKRFTFDVHEYLKGSGGDVIIADVRVDCPCGCPYDSEQEAIDVANNWISHEADRWREDIVIRWWEGYHSGDQEVMDSADWIFGVSDLWQEYKASRWWENNESIIFLEENELGRSESSGQSAATMYKFIPWIEHRNPIHNYATASRLYPYSDTDGFSVLSGRHRVWLPATTSSAGPPWPSESRFMLGEMPEDLELPAGSSSFVTEISLSDLKSRIEAVTDLVKQGEDVAKYEECLLKKLQLSRSPWRPYSLTFPIQSGLSANLVIVSSDASGDEYGIYFFSGLHNNLFEIILEDDDNNPRNTYYRTVKTLRPLPNGDYLLTYHQKSGILRHCVNYPENAYVDKPTANWTIRATAPTGTLHEAFFDPVAIGAAVGADSDNGALTPAGFPSASGVDTEIRRVAWESDAVTIEITNPPVSLLANHHIDFIALDGSIPLRLDFDDAAIVDAEAVRTFRWSVCNQPWDAGDKLMLRISESPADLEGTTNWTSCSDTATPTPSPTMTPTLESGTTGQ